MDGMGEQRRPRRAFTPEFKAEIVEACRRGNRSIGQVAKDFDLTETAVRDWVRQADIDAGVRGDGLTSDERAEVAALRREHRRLREEILELAPLANSARDRDGHVTCNHHTRRHAPISSGCGRRAA